jgi:acyl carrier protein
MKTFDSLAIEMLRIPVCPDIDALTPKDVPQWDSMNYLLFIAELEKEYGVTFTMDEVLSAQSLGDVRKALQAKGAHV